MVKLSKCLNALDWDRLSLCGETDQRSDIIMNIGPVQMGRLISTGSLVLGAIVGAGSGAVMISHFSYCIIRTR